jgi:hypothetical protein
MGDFHMNDPLQWLWPLVEAPESMVAAHIVESWPQGVHGRLVELGFLVQAENADRVLCPECHGHFEEVVASEGPVGRVRFFVPCSEVHRAPVSPEARHQWSINFAVLAKGLATSFGLTGRCIEQLPGRVWRLGQMTWQGRPRDVMLARGLHWDDAPSMCIAIRQGRKPIVFIAQTKPIDDHWRGRVPPLLALSQVATLGEKGVEVDAMEVVAAIEDAEARANASDMSVVSKQDMNLMIRQQAKAESKTNLTDDIFVAAFRMEGSLRKAAAFLSEQTGQEVSKDRVHRALKRAGGVQAVRDNESSESIQRTVASQRRDRKKKFASPMQPPEIE